MTRSRGTASAGNRAASMMVRPIGLLCFWSTRISYVAGCVSDAKARSRGDTYTLENCHWWITGQIQVLLNFPELTNVSMFFPASLDHAGAYGSIKLLRDYCDDFIDHTPPLSL